jgi:hypothetical protein
MNRSDQYHTSGSSAISSPHDSTKAMAAAERRMSMAGKRVLTADQARALLNLTSRVPYPKLHQKNLLSGLEESMMPRLVTLYLVDLATESCPKLAGPVRIKLDRRRIVRSIREWIGRRPCIDDMVSTICPLGTIDSELKTIIETDLGKQLAAPKRKKRKGRRPC